MKVVLSGAREEEREVQGKRKEKEKKERV